MLTFSRLFIDKPLLKCLFFKKKLYAMAVLRYLPRLKKDLGIAFSADFLMYDFP